LEFRKALELMKQGVDVKRPHWSGFWRLEDGKIMMYCKDGQVLDFRETKDTLFTISSILSDDWEVADAVNSKLLNGEIISTFTFGEALRNMKQGNKVARKGWNGHGMWAVMQKGYPDGIHINKNTAEATGIPEGTLMKFRPYFMLFTAQGDFAHWVPSSSDILADDWQIVE